MVGRFTPLETDPAPRMSGVTLTGVPPRGPGPAANAATETRHAPAPNINSTARRRAIAASDPHAGKSASIGSISTGGQAPAMESTGIVRKTEAPWRGTTAALGVDADPAGRAPATAYSTVTLFARFLGLSTSVPRSTAV